MRPMVHKISKITSCLKGPKHEKFEAGIFFTQIRPAWIGELETRPKTSKN
jgi:hypothetical protein